jgi:predicted branched-subunit amino acid permease
VKMATDVQPVLVPAPGEEDPAAPAAVVHSARIQLLIGLSAVAGLIHGKAFIDHVEHYWLFGVFFAFLTYAQVLWAVQLWRRPDDRRLFKAVVVMSLGTVAIWFVSRTVGLPIGPWAGRPEAVGLPDLVASLDEVLIAVIIGALMRPEGRVAARVRWLDAGACIRVGSMLCSLSMMALLFSSHTHPK